MANGDQPKYVQTNNPIVGSNNSAAVPAQTAAAPSSAPAPPDVNNADNPPPAVTSLPITQPSTGPIVAAGQSMNGGQRLSTARKLLQAVTGGQTTDFVQTDKGPVPVKRNLSGGELARRVLASVGSIFAAGTGGMLAAKEHRPFQLAPGTSLGDIQQAPIRERQQQAQQEFENTRAANKDVLDAHRAAQEQMESMARVGQYNDAHNAAVQAAATRDLENTKENQAIQDKFTEQREKSTMYFNQALAMPGAEIMKDASGKVLSFPPDNNNAAAKAYAIAHPEVVHGSTDGKNKYGVIAVVNPWTSQTQFVDFPINQHAAGIENYGQKIDPKTNKPIFDEKGNPVPNDSPFDDEGNPVKGGYILDPKTGKPTVVTETITPDQAQTLASQQINQQNVAAQMADRKAQARKYDAQAKQNQDLDDARNLFESGNFDKMTEAQKNMYSKMVLNQENDARKIYLNQSAILARLMQQDQSKDDPEVISAQKDYDEAKSIYEGKRADYDRLTGNTPGVQLANSIIRTGIGNRPWADIDKQIASAQISDDEKQAAKARVWNSLSPAQQAAANPQTAKKVPPQPAPAGQAYIYDLQGNPHTVAANLVDQYLASPTYKGWSK
jgi:hypothetical protein